MAPFFTGIARNLGGTGFGRSESAAAPVGPAAITGGTVTAAGITPGNGYRYHVFTAAGTLTSPQPKTIDYLIIAGGGGGGEQLGAGGGAGGVLYSTSYSLSSGSYPVQVGGGGPGATMSPPFIGTPGTPSFIGPIIATGGGGGEGNNGGAATGQPGGSGGGAADPTGAGSGIPGQGFPGGVEGGSAQGGGGGGAGGAGNPGAPGQPGTGPGGGGPGSPFTAFAAPLISPEIPAPAQPTWIPAVGPTGLYGGGGAGGGYPTAGTGGPGGGGSVPPAGNGNPGVNFTGGGGAGASATPSLTSFVGGQGGTGIVIIRYLA